MRETEICNGGIPGSAACAPVCPGADPHWITDDQFKAMIEKGAMCFTAQDWTEVKSALMISREKGVIACPTR